MLNRNKIRRRLVLVAVAAAALVGLSATVVKQSPYSPFDWEYYLTDEQISIFQPGLDLTIEDVEIAADRTVSVVFRIQDEGGLPLDRDGVYTPAQVRTSFLLGTIPQGGGQYVSYITRSVTSPITGETAIQPTSDSGGTYEKLEDGLYRYTFGNKLPEGYDENATHTLGIYADRRLDREPYNLQREVDNELFTFVPSGADVVDVREVVTTDSCNQCHDPLRIHGRRVLVGICIMCHTKDVIDPDSGNSIDLKIMAHKIHRGANLPSVQAGIPYVFRSGGGGVDDFSEVEFPQDIRNCDTCHVEEAAQHEAYLLNPSREVCGSCHDDVNFATGENHVGGPQISDNLCGGCHLPVGELEFDASVMGAHTIPEESAQLPGLNVELIEVQNTGPGEFPVVRFAVTNDAGEAIDPATLNRIRLRFSGPTTDYRHMFEENVGNGAVAVGDGTYTYTFMTPIPADATGSYAFGVEARQEEILNPGTTNEMEVEDQAENTVIFVGVTDAEPVPRRQIVDDAKCEECHRNLSLHGDNRKNASAYCQMCHYPLNDDGAVRPEEELPVQSIDFRFMIHRIHSGEELERDFTVYGYRSSVHNFNHVLYPGDRRNCEKCHVNDSYEVPIEGVLSVPTPREFFSPLPPNSAACLGCHDSLSAAAHAYTQISPFGEACAACHGDEAEFSVEYVHAR